MRSKVKRAESYADKHCKSHGVIRSLHTWVLVKTGWLAGWRGGYSAGFKAGRVYGKEGF